MKKVGRLYREAMAEELKRVLEKRDNFLIINYSEINVSDLTSLRQDLKAKDAEFLAVKNTIAKHVLGHMQFRPEIKELFDRPSAFIFASDDLIAVSKCLSAFIEQHPGLIIRGGICGRSQSIDLDEFRKLARLPSIDALKTKAVLSLKLPLINLTAILDSFRRKLLLVLSSITEKRKGEKDG